jgi:hypothetical protein
VFGQARLGRQDAIIRDNGNADPRLKVCLPAFPARSSGEFFRPRTEDEGGFSALSAGGNYVEAVHLRVVVLEDRSQRQPMCGETIQQTHEPDLIPN